MKNHFWLSFVSPFALMMGCRENEESPVLPGYDKELLTFSFFAENNPIHLKKEDNVDEANTLIIDNQGGGGAIETKAVIANIDSTAQYLNVSQAQNFKRWKILGKRVWPNPVVPGSYGGEVAYMKNCLNTRIEWMDSQFSSL